MRYDRSYVDRNSEGANVYPPYLIWRHCVRMLGIMLTLFCVSACNTTATKTPATNSPAEPAKDQLLTTAGYIPLLENDKEGNSIPYVAQMDPYSAISGRIDKESILSFIEAKRAFNAKQYKKSRLLLLKLTKKETKLSGPWLVLGDISTREKNTEEAIVHYQKAIEVNPLNVNAYLKLALTQRQTGQFLSAQHTYRNALEQWRDFPEAHLNLGILYDIYLNHPIRAQRHIEAYQFLTRGEDKEVAQWLTNLQLRTGLALKLTVPSDELALQNEP